MKVTKSVSELINEAKEEVETISASEVRSLNDAGALLLDVREAGEWAEGHLANAKHLSRGTLEFKIDDVEKDKARRIVTYCASGARAALAAARLTEMGYAGAVASGGGYEDLKSSGMPIDG